MTKVTLLGDSIRLLGYGTKVPELLGEEYSVFQPFGNCRFAKYTLRLIFELDKEISGSDIIHWNNGLWDVSDLFGDGVFTDIDEYVALMVRIAKLLKQRGKIVIFATTTPIIPGYPYQDNERIKAYNNAVVPELEKLGIIINDLYPVVEKDINKYIRSDDMIHLSDEGIDVCAKKVAAVIREYAAKL